MATKDKDTKKLKNTSSLKKQAKLQEKVRLTPNINKFLQEEYYSKTQGTKRPLVYTGKNRTNAFGQTVKKFNDDFFLGKYNFPKREIKLKTAEEARKAFDEVHYPLAVIVPKHRQAGLGIAEAIPKFVNGKKNCIRYYTKNKKLSQAQCDVLYREEDHRSVHGYLINDKYMSTEMLLDYLSKVQKYDEIKDAIEEQDEIINTKAIQEYGRKLRTQRAIKEIAPKVEVNPDGSRKPSLGVLQMGMNSYMLRNKLKNPTEIIKTHATGEKYKIYDSFNLGRVLAELNINSQEAFDYICSYLNKNKKILRVHTEDRETERGASALKNLIDFFNAENKRTTDDRRKGIKVKVYGYPQLMESEQYAEYCRLTGEKPITGYESFRKWARAKIDFINNISKKK